MSTVRMRTQQSAVVLVRGRMSAVKLLGIGSFVGSSEFHDRDAILASSQNGRGRLAGMGAKPRILLVEDDRQLAGTLADLFEEEGYEVDVAHDGQVGLHLALTRSYDAFVFDRGVPVIDGVELLRTLRARDCSVPSLILTARGSVADRVEGLDAGAEDYLVKPFEIPELLARMRALLRRRTSVVPIVVDRARSWDGCNDGRLLLDRICATAPGVLQKEGTILLIQSALSGIDRTVELLADNELEASVVSRTSIPFGPVLLSRRRYLESIGVIDPDQVTEEIVVIRARR